jgi:diaminopimelate epimerase
MEVKPRQPSENVLYFSKYHAAGNDFILVDGIDHPQTPSWWHYETIHKLCHRNYGIGGDGLIVLLESSECDYRMKYFNADGHEAEICGNGLRCLALFIRDQGHPIGEALSIETLGGPVSCEILAGDRVRVEMPPVKFSREDIPMREEGDLEDCIDEELKLDKDTTLKITALSVGNPHVVIFGNFTDEQCFKWGPEISEMSLFPEGVNVSFVKLEGMDKVVQRVWERGSGATLACGSGAVAAVAAGIANGHLPFGAKIRVQQPGGELSVAIADEYREATLEGEAVYVFHGLVEF